ncbi:MAG TPA: ribosomal-protein-alanine N-acetyltransferase [Gammaproteobacteria bacterium]|nr:ribosomal-protein-alanine N-acetyltransferase [Gammaproteobacteria bacterium]
MEMTDLPAVLAIEQAAYEFPWTAGIFRDCLRIGYECYVAEGPAGIVAYGILSIGAGESHVLNLCVHPGHRRRGLGRRMLRFLMERARMARVDCILLEVRPSNRVAIRLYRSLGFNEVGLRKGYYPAHVGREDALIFAYEF